MRLFVGDSRMIDPINFGKLYYNITLESEFKHNLLS